MAVGEAVGRCPAFVIAKSGQHASAAKSLSRLKRSQLEGRASPNSSRDAEDLGPGCCWGQFGEERSQAPGLTPGR